jgi:hypothetical protein
VLPKWGHKFIQQFKKKILLHQECHISNSFQQILLKEVEYFVCN